ncbi:hypothetical protein TNCV_607411 [Trichonephila clavipes]|nr:hypothetical protein TNCV_607411 [Trichonephila clavipes]
MDKAFYHTSKSTADYVAKKESEALITSVPLDEISIKSPNASSMDLCAFGLLERTLGKQPPRTLNRDWKTIQEEWNKIYTTVLTSRGLN